MTVGATVPAVGGHVFVSYGRRSGGAYVTKLVSFLARTGIAAWFDQGIAAGTGTGGGWPSFE
jgi:hypothetical protein